MNKIAAVSAVTAMLLTAAPALAKVTVDVNAATGVNVGSTTQIQINAEGSANANDNAPTAAGSAQSGATVTITRGDVDDDNGATVTVTTPSGVHTNADASAYASSVVKADENVSGVELTEKAVAVSYKTRARLFGLIPIFMTATAHVDASGEVTISYPWYAFLAAKDENSLKSDVGASVAASLAENAHATLTASEQAAILDQVRAAMESNLKATLAAEGSADATVQ